MKSLNPSPERWNVSSLFDATGETRGWRPGRIWTQLETGAAAWVQACMTRKRTCISGTGNATPTYTQGRGEGDNLFTGALIAADV